MEKAFTVLGWITLITLSLAIARQLSEQKYIYELPDSWGAQFAKHGQAGRQGLLENFGDYSGSPAKSEAPYKLLADVLPEKKTDGTLTAQTCYQSDFLEQSNKVGNYIQRTNNFHHGTPDNCSAGRTELVDSFYKNEKIPA
jgi:hypothetical protein